MEKFGRDDQLFHQDDGLEIDIMLSYWRRQLEPYVTKNKHIERLMRQPITKFGYNYNKKTLKEDP